MADTSKKLTWDPEGQHYYKTGVNHGVLFPALKTINDAVPTIPGSGVNGKYYGTGVAWNGLVTVSESPEGGEPTDLWANNAKYGSIYSAETLGGTIEAYTYPDEFNACNGYSSIEALPGLHVAQQNREAFGFCCETTIGSDKTGDAGVQYNIYYNCKASPSEEEYATINDSPDASTMSWDFDTTPFSEFKIGENSFKKTSCLKFTWLAGGSTASMKSLTDDQKQRLEEILYGTESTDPCLPGPQELITVLMNVGQ